MITFSLQFYYSTFSINMDYSFNDESTSEGSQSESEDSRSEGELKSESGSEYDSDMEYKCNFCPNYMKGRSLAVHVKRKHKLCQYCNKRMPKVQYDVHVDTHYVQCSNCSGRILKTDMASHKAICELEKCEYCTKSLPMDSMEMHIDANHRRLVGVKVPEIHDDEFNKLVAASRIYAHNGRIYVK